MVCQAIQDSIPITNLDFTFLAGNNEMLSNFICVDLWDVREPDQIRLVAGEGMEQKSFLYLLIVN